MHRAGVFRLVLFREARGLGLLGPRHRKTLLFSSAHPRLLSKSLLFQLPRLL